VVCHDEFEPWWGPLVADRDVSASTLLCCMFMFLTHIKLAGGERVTWLSHKYLY
jgi:hypothetical protein